MVPKADNAKEGLGTGLIAFLIVLTLDVPVTIGATLTLMKHSVVPGYTYYRETCLATGVLLAYALVVLGLGLYGYRTHQRTARLTGMLLGLVPVIVIAWQFIVQLNMGPAAY